MKYALRLLLLMIMLWAILSGMTKPLIVGLGIASCALVVWIAVRMDRVDGFHTPLIPSIIRLVRYTLWLTREIVVANIAVAKLAIAPKLSLKPSMVTVDATDLTELGQVIYANSITLTPGTVSLFIRDGKIEVHSLIDEAAEDLASDRMRDEVRLLGPAVVRKPKGDQ